MAGGALGGVGFILRCANNTALVDVAYAVNLNLARIQGRVGVTVSTYNLICVWPASRMDLQNKAINLTVTANTI
jgi:uncharacterized protein YdbL (DUF1318 family)